MFFSNEQNRAAIKQFLNISSNNQTSEKNISDRLEASQAILTHIIDYPNVWDDSCKFNIDKVGEQLIGRLRLFYNNDKNSIDDIYIILYRFLRELDLSTYSNLDLERVQRYMESEIKSSLGGTDDSFNSQMIYASYMMPIDILKTCLNHPDITVLASFQSTLNEASRLKEDWNKEIESKTSEVSALRDKLDEYKNAFNFVGLYDGFKTLSQQKKSEEKYCFWALLGMALLIIAPLCFEVYTNIQALNAKQSIGVERLFILVPLLSIEVIFIYFFRVLLNNHSSIKAQLMQLELRQTLCQFIQSYTEYSAKMKKNDSVSLDKFENIIFSGIISNSEKLPSAFDGMEQISKLMKSIKSS
ncbi:hypothetical protein [Moritella sp.]|uniref:hypothetical protein n=1 Tax=Moritella sp. TaxID=78556 RepID=UPI0025FF5C8D|nr:hypothetical protein [Moritella sp.]MCJ8348287.1 hypothetical protein [Moritella sp.]